MLASACAHIDYKSMARSPVKINKFNIFGIQSERGRRPSDELRVPPSHAARSSPPGKRVDDVEGGGGCGSINTCNSVKYDGVESLVNVIP